MPSFTPPIDTQLDVTHTDVARHAVFVVDGKSKGTRATTEAFELNLGPNLKAVVLLFEYAA